MSTELNKNLDELKCRYCGKKFKSSKSKTRHQHQQICVSDSEKTYCKNCDYTADTLKEYKKHLLTMEHLSNVTGLKTKAVKLKKSMLDLDPYLSDNEKDELSNPVIAKFVIKHKDNTITPINAAVELKKYNNIRKAEKAEELRKKELEEEKARQEEESKYLGGIHYVGEVENKLDYQSVLNAELYTLPPTTERQERIIAFLIKAADADEQVKKDKLKQIMRLISIEDANYLMSHIRRCDKLNIQAKQFYMNFIDSFIMELIKLMNRGIIMIGDKKIIDFITKLSK